MFNISTHSFEVKPQRGEIKSLKFKTTNLTIDELCNCIKSGKSFCNVFNYQGSEMPLSFKRDSNFALSQCVMIDIDGDVDKNLFDFVDSLSLKPTISYTTFSHQNDGNGNRYRLLYLFEDHITECDTYSLLYDYIVKTNGLNLSDNCGRSPLEKPRGFDPFGHAGFDPVGKINLTL